MNKFKSMHLSRLELKFEKFWFKINENGAILILFYHAFNCLVAYNGD